MTMLPCIRSILQKNNNSKKHPVMEILGTFNKNLKLLENNEDLCRELLELILGKKIRRINYLAKQKNVNVRMGMVGSCTLLLGVIQ